MLNLSCNFKFQGLTPIPMISIIIPVRPGASAQTALDSIQKADYPKELIETIVVEGNNPSRQRNEGIRKAKGDIIFFLDDDSEVTPDLFRKTVAVYKQYPDASCVGGPAVLYGETNLQKAVIAILTSYLGVYKIRARYFPVGKTRYTDENELISCNLSFRRQVFEKENGFNEKLYPNEENELIQELIRKGHRFLYEPGCQIRRQADKDIEAFLRRIFNYGRGRMEQLILTPSKTSFYRLLPLGFLIYLIILLSVLNPYFYLPFFLYLAAVLVYSYRSSRNRLKIFPVVSALYLATHILYALGELWGIYSGIRLKNAKTA